MTTTPTTTPPEWVSIAQAAREFDLDSSTLRRLLRLEQVEVLHLPRSYRVRRADVSRILKERTRPMEGD